MPRASQPQVPPEIYVATTSGGVRIKGKVYRFVSGKTRVRPDHPLVKARPDCFALLTLDFEEG